MQGPSSVRRWLRFAAAGVLLTGAAAFVACSDDKDDEAGDTTPVATQAATEEASGDEKVIEQVFINAIERWNAKDLDGFLTFLTDAGVISSFGEGSNSLDEAKANLTNFFGTVELGTPEFSDVSVSGDTGSMDAVFGFGPVLLHSKFGLVKVGPDWKLNSEESNLPVDVPTGATTIEVDLNEFAFGTDVTAIAGATGVFALEAKNVGKQTHMLALARVPAGANIEELLKQEDSPDVEFIAAVDDVAPGTSKSLVFAKPLDAGRYVMVCFLPDTDEGEDGTPHVFKGMLKEFTVE